MVSRARFLCGLLLAVTLLLAISIINVNGSREISTRCGEEQGEQIRLACEHENEKRNHHRQLKHCSERHIRKYHCDEPEHKEDDDCGCEEEEKPKKPEEEKPTPKPVHKPYVAPPRHHHRQHHHVHHVHRRSEREKVNDSETRRLHRRARARKLRKQKKKQAKKEPFEAPVDENGDSVVTSNGSEIHIHVTQLSTPQPSAKALKHIETKLDKLYTGAITKVNSILDDIDQHKAAKKPCLKKIAKLMQKWKRSWVRETRHIEAIANKNKYSDADANTLV